MSLNTIKKCCRRARECKLSCLELMNVYDEQIHANDIEKIKKEIKNKRCAFDQDHAVITDLVKAIDEDEKCFKKTVP